MFSNLGVTECEQVFIKQSKASSHDPNFSLKSEAWRQGLKNISIKRQYFALSSVLSRRGIGGPIGTGTRMSFGARILRMCVFS
jgi:hypothetical protein